MKTATNRQDLSAWSSPAAPFSCSSPPSTAARRLLTHLPNPTTN
ncbi:hypothetical protein ARSEF4850_009266, partial [Beauveria asiatica]